MKAPDRIVKEKGIKVGQKGLSCRVIFIFANLVPDDLRAFFSVARDITP